MIRYILCSFIFSLMCCLVMAQKSNAKKSSLDNYCQCEHVFLNSDTSNSNKGGLKILQTGHQMALIDMKVIKGSCWDFVNAVYNRSGFANAKQTIFSSRKNGPFAASSLVKPGDWIYHINHQYSNGEHSAIFICWKDFAKRIAITLSYVGMNRNAPGHFGEYHLDNIYSIFRPKNNL